MSRVRAPAPVRGWGIPPTEPFLCGRCGWPLWFGSVWWEHRTVSGRPAVRVHRICAREPAPGFPGYAVREVSGA